MPCNIGYRSYAKVEIPEPQPQTFTNKAEAPNIDEELLDKLGIEDSEFLQWAKELNTRPLLEEALKRALKNSSVKGVEFRVDAKGMLDARGQFVTAKEKKLLTDQAASVSERWQFEILGIVAQLLDYEVQIKQSGKVMMLEASEQDRVHPCNFIRVTRHDGVSELVFEHFKTRKALELEVAKFIALANRLGVKIAIKTNEVHEGDPFPQSHEHTHKHTHYN